MQDVNAGDKPSYSSKELHEKVMSAHRLQHSRSQKNLNGRLSDEEVDRYCIMDEESGSLLHQAVMRFALSFRSIKKIQKVSRTIADLDGSETIGKRHLLEALSYRRRAS